MKILRMPALSLFVILTATSCGDNREYQRVEGIDYRDLRRFCNESLTSLGFTIVNPKDGSDLFSSEISTEMNRAISKYDGDVCVGVKIDTNRTCVHISPLLPDIDADKLFCQSN